MTLSQVHKGIIIGLIVGYLACHLWQRRAGSGSSEGG